MAISKVVRFEVFKRDRFTCQYCGSRPPDVTLEVDHIVPVAGGGTDEIENLTTSCFNCNRGKGKRDLGAVAPHLDELEVMAAVQEMLERKRGLEAKLRTAKALRKSEDKVSDAVYDWIATDLGVEVVAAVDGPSIQRFVKHLDPENLRDAVMVTARHQNRKPHLAAERVWQYFCGVCWRKIRNEDLGSPFNATPGT